MNKNLTLKDMKHLILYFALFLTILTCCKKVKYNHKYKIAVVYTNGDKEKFSYNIDNCEKKELVFVITSRTSALKYVGGCYPKIIRGGVRSFEILDKQITK